MTSRNIIPTQATELKIEEINQQEQINKKKEQNRKRNERRKAKKAEAKKQVENSVSLITKTLKDLQIKDKKQEVSSSNQKQNKQKNRRNDSGYANFFCKCGNKFNNFEKFTIHIKEHGIKNINFKQLLDNYQGKKREIKFYWGLNCSCGHKFTSSLCNADLKVVNGEIKIEKIYRLKCSRCKKYANFRNEDKLKSFLKERTKQRFIYHFYKGNFSKFEDNIVREKELKDHRQDLCEKCKLSPTGDCRDERL